MAMCPKSKGLRKDRTYGGQFMEIRDSAAVVTGGASGLGEACVRNLVNRGGKVAILDFAEDRGEKVASELGDSVIF